MSQQYIPTVHSTQPVYMVSESWKPQYECSLPTKPQTLQFKYRVKNKLHIYSTSMASNAPDTYA
jgi:dTDP-4-dehydrorhamnose 3,5-epimerase-like enzyme